jgi:hypothetical protein
LYLILQTPDHSLHGIDGSVENAGLHAGDGISADDGLGETQLDLWQFRRTAMEIDG